ncbi:MAG: polysaccharide export protein [Scytolyngbya sp. HA4215-MV1]|nr:polysaccharide export protein [Scytolyngbya sp. HA4215-MV1]
MPLASFSRIHALAVASLTGFYAIVPTASFAVSSVSGNSKLLNTAPIIAQTAPPATATPPNSTPLPPDLAPSTTNPLPPTGNALPPDTPQQTDSDPQFQKYRLGPGDSIAVVLPRFPDLNFAAVVNPEGNIIAPLIGPILVNGLTIEEAQEKIRIGLSRFVIDPVVILSLSAQRPVQVTIVGEISKPGFYTLGVSKIPAALLTAGGTTTRADLREIQIRRTLPDGSVLAKKFDLFTPLVNGKALPDFRIADGDVIIVPKLEVGTDQGYDRVLVARSTVVKPQITVRVLSYASGGISNLTLPNGSTFIDAVAGGSLSLTNANLRSIALVRFDPEQGRAVTQHLNARRAFRGDISQNVPLQDNDVIIVGRDLVGKITNALNVFTQPFRDVLGFLLFFDQLQQSSSNLFGPGGNGRGGGGGGN